MSETSRTLVAEAPTFVETEIDPRALWNLLIRRRLVFFGVVLAVLAGGILLTMRWPRIYRGSTTVLIEAHAPDVLGGVREVYDLGDVVYTHDYYQTQYSIIKSIPVAEKVVGTLGLNAAALLEQLREAGPTPMEARATREGLYGLPPALRTKLAMLGMGNLHSREEIAEQLTGFDSVATVQRKIQVEPVPDSRLVRIYVEDSNPEYAAQLADAVADAYIELNLDQKIDFTRSAVNWLSDQMRDLKQSLETSELRLYEFKKSNNIVSMSMEDRQTMTSQTLSQLNQSLSSTYAQRLALEARREEMRHAAEAVSADADGDTAGFSDHLTEVVASPVMEHLKSVYMDLLQEKADLEIRYTAQHPRVSALNDKIAIVRDNMRREVQSAVQRVEQDYDTILGTEQRLRRAIESVKDDALALNKQEIEYDRLKRERDNNQGLYDLVLKRQKEADLSQMLKVNNVRRLEAARVPTRPVRPNIQTNLVVSLFLGLVSGIAAAFMVDFLDSSIKSQDQLEKITGLAFLGIVPTMKADKPASTELNNSGRDQFALQHPRSSVAECYRNVRTNLLFLSPDKPIKSIVVSSSEPREGKSTTVVNLALSIAQSGKRVLIIDTDMRRPRLHKSFGLPNDVGITAVIMGQMDSSRAIQNVASNLDLLACGPIPPNPAELLHTDSFRALIQELGRRYDFMIFDSPPVAAVTDTSVLASMVDGVILIVKAGRTTWQAVRHCRRRLEDVNARIFGVILNNVDLEDKRTGGYQYYYQYYRYGSEDVEQARRA